MSRTVDEYVSLGRARMTASATEGTDLQPREVFLLLGHVLGWNEARVRARGEHRLSRDQGARFKALLDRRCGGEPMAYVLGTREFFGRDFVVDSRVLIPRPETEHLIEAVVERADRLPSCPWIVDVGTGSGCIAVTLACELAGSKVVATDLSVPALRVARQNARRLGVADKVFFTAMNLASGCRLEAVDLVVSNPPYVAPAAAAGMSKDVLEFEPHSALFAPDHGRGLIRALLDTAVGLRTGTVMVIELGFDQGEWVEAAVRARVHLRWEALIRDYAGHARVAVCRRA